MRKIVLSILTSVLLTSIFTAYGSNSQTITMTTTDNEVSFLLRGNGIVTIDWGDGSERATQTLDEQFGAFFQYTYPNATTRTITISGESITALSANDNQLTNLDVREATNLISLMVMDNQLTNLDVSRNVALETLWVSNNELTNLDVSRNTALRVLYVGDNLFSADAQNALFHTLHSNDIEGKTICVGRGSVGVKGDRSIVDNKGWGFSDIEYLIIDRKLMRQQLDELMKELMLEFE